MSDPELEIVATKVADMVWLKFQNRSPWLRGSKASRPPLADRSHNNFGVCAMAVDLDWLVSRFDKVSIDYPGLALVGRPKPARFTDSNCEVDCEPSEDYCFYYPKLRGSKYEPQLYWPDEDSPQPKPDDQGIITLTGPFDPHLEFPCWYFWHHSPIFERGWWAMWLHRTFGFDPRTKDPNQQIQKNSECLKAYQPLLELATQVLLDFYGGREWFFEWCPEAKNERFNFCGPWLLFVLAHYTNPREDDGVCVIDDIGIATISALRALRNAPTSADGLPPPTEFPTSASVTPCPYQTLWDYAQKMWASGTDKFKICQHISSGPGNYSACVADLVPDVGRTDQTKRFHAVVGVLNQQICGELGLRVYRPYRSQQILVERINESPNRNSKTANPKRSTKKTSQKKSTTKRKR